MAKSTRIKLSDVQTTIRLVGECRELGDDPIVWRQHFYAALGKLTGADLVLGAEASGCLRGPMRLGGGTAWGFEHGFNREGYQVVGKSFAEDPFQSQLWCAQVEAVRARPGTGVAIPYQRVLSDAQWHRSMDYQQISRSMGADAVLHSLQPSDEQRDQFDGVALCRPPGRPKFGRREVALVKLVHQEVSRLVGGPLARCEEPSPSQLPLRMRQVLRCLLEGDGDKQVATRLNLSPHTVNQYTKQIYRHFSVTSRSELLARWVRRAWGIKSNWDAAATAPQLVVPNEHSAEDD